MDLLFIVGQILFGIVCVITLGYMIRWYIAQLFRIRHNISQIKAMKAAGVDMTQIPMSREDLKKLAAKALDDFKKQQAMDEEHDKHNYESGMYQ